VSIVTTLKEGLVVGRAYPPIRSRDQAPQRHRTDLGRMKIDGKLGRNWLKEHWVLQCLRSFAVLATTSHWSSIS
jgi:hypothetical protein